MSGRILIIEDDEEMCEELRVLFNDLGYDVSLAMDGLRGKRLVEENDFDVVILDLKLPMHDGFELLEFFKDKNKDFKILVLSARPMRDERLPLNRTEPILEEEERILKMADSILIKPIDPHKLLTIIGNFVQNDSLKFRINMPIVECS